MSETRGLFAPESTDEARAQFEAAGPAAQTVTREVTRAMEFSAEEYGERVTSDVIETARDATFASLLRVEVGDYEAFESFCADHPDADVMEEGSSDVQRAAWHYAPFADTVVATTFENEPDAAVATLRRIAFARVYRDAL